MLKSTHVYLSPLLRRDSQVMFEWINNRDQILFNAPYKPVHENNHEAWFQSVTGRNDLVIFAIRLLKDERLVGSCQLGNIHPIHRCADLQIRLGVVDERSKGYGTEAINLLLDFGFNDLNLNRVQLHVYEFNHAAIRVYEKVGLKREGLMREAVFLDGNYRNVVNMAILRSEYDERRNETS